MIPPPKIKGKSNLILFLKILILAESGKCISCNGRRLYEVMTECDDIIS